MSVCLARMRIEKETKCANAVDMYSVVFSDFVYSYQLHDQAQGNHCSSPPELIGIPVDLEAKLPKPCVTGTYIKLLTLISVK